VLFLIGLRLGILYYRRALTEKELQATLEEIDRIDPGWRLEELEAKRAVVPREKNAGPQVLAAIELLPEDWPRGDRWDDFRDLEPPAQLSPEQVKTLRAELDKVKPALMEARKLTQLSAGRFDIQYSPDFIGTLIPHTQETRRVAKLLSWDTLRRLQEKDLQGALASNRATLIAGRAIGDEPLLISALVRTAIQVVAVEDLERILAQGEPAAATLENLQKLLEDEAAQPLLLIGFRGERAGVHHMCSNLEAGEVSFSQLDSFGNQSKKEPGVWDRVTDFFAVDVIMTDHIWLLKLHTEAVRIAEGPVEHYGPLYKQLAATVHEAPGPLAKLMSRGVTKVPPAVQRGQAHLRCAIVALAAERFRRNNKRWPNSLQELVPNYLARVPTDPFDGAPLRLGKHKEGVVVYSVGPDGKDNGGTIDRTDPLREGTDLGFRLWNITKRRQPAKPAKPKPVEPPDGFPPNLDDPPGGEDR
jgi:hypothetical protein